MNYLIENATLVNEGQIFVASVFVSDGKIAKIVRKSEVPEPAVAEHSRSIEGPACRVIDAKGKYLIPGIIDEHVHFREPGLTYKADIYTESRAAVAGGVTSFMDMPNTIPPTTTQELLQQKFDLAAEKSLANYSFYLGASNDNLVEIVKTDPKKVCGIKVFMGSSTGNMLVDDDDALERIFKESPCLIAAHCEDEEIIKHNAELYKEMVDREIVEAKAPLHPKIRTETACYLSSSKAIDLAEKADAKLHILHISTEMELELFRNDIPLKDKKITAETCPHYLRFDDDDYRKMKFGIKCNPAIKSEKNRLALMEAVRKGLIDTIGSDHAPHRRNEKYTGNYFTSKSGFASIQHSLEVMLEWVHLHELSFPKVVQLMCHNPAILYQIDRRGFIREGYHADLALVDLNARHQITTANEYTKCHWTPYKREWIQSRVTHTFVNGNLVYENGEFYEESRGERLLFNR